MNSKRTKRDILIVDGTTLAIKWLITFPLNGVTRIRTVLQITHLIPVPLKRIYPENRDKPPLNFTTLDSFLKNSDLAQYFNQLRRYSIQQDEDTNLESIDTFEGRSYQLLRNMNVDFETFKNDYYVGKMSEDEKRHLTEFLSHLDAMRRENTRKKFEKSIIYKDIITLFEKFGLSGRGCLLHTICEIADSPFEGSLVGEMFNLIMTPCLQTRSKLSLT
ncbi:hypothetical protein Avbf_00005 [Armadillidium vulgare]|nr:hypothetical protein Avbf_00005 [Armadillidium vulgare]